MEGFKAGQIKEARAGFLYSRERLCVWWESSCVLDLAAVMSRNHFPHIAGDNWTNLILFQVNYVN